MNYNQKSYIKFHKDNLIINVYIKYIKVVSHIAIWKQLYFLGFSAYLQLNVQL